MFHVQLHKNIFLCYRELCKKLVQNAKLTHHRAIVPIATLAMRPICANGENRTPKMNSNAAVLYAVHTLEFIKSGVKSLRKIVGIAALRIHKCTMRIIQNHWISYGYAENVT